MGEAINLVNNFKVEKVIFNCGEFNESEQELIKIIYIHRNETIFFVNKKNIYRHNKNKIS